MNAASTTSTDVANCVFSSTRAALKHVEDLRTDVSRRVRAAIIGAVTFLRARCPARAQVSLRTTALALGVGEGVLRRRVRKAEGVTASEGSLLFEWQRGLRSDKVDLSVATDYWHVCTRVNPDVRDVKKKKIGPGQELVHANHIQQHSVSELHAGFLQT